MHARGDLADARSHMGLFSQIGDVFPLLSDDDASLLCVYESAKSEDVLSRGG